MRLVKKNKKILHLTVLSEKLSVNDLGIELQWSTANKACPPIRHAAYCPMRDKVVIFMYAVRQLDYIRYGFAKSLGMRSSEAQHYSQTSLEGIPT